MSVGGVIPAVVTPFAAGGAGVDLEALDAHAACAQQLPSAVVAGAADNPLVDDRTAAAPHVRAIRRGTRRADGP
jgi:hypothetical protein